MSLIDEALKRARHEAARQEAAKRDASRHDGPRPVPRLYTERRRSRAPLVAGVASGVAVVLLGVVGWLLWGRPSATPALPASVGPAATPPARTTSSAAPVATLPLSPPAPQAPPTPTPALRSARNEAVEIPPAPANRTASQVTPRSTEAAVEQPVAAPKPAPATPAAPAGGSATYVREAALPNGGPRFRLGGIAYSEEAPVALINGSALGKGEVVEGYVVRRIDAQEVELEGPAGRVVLRLN